MNNLRETDDFAARLSAEMERRNAAIPAMLYSVNQAGRLLSASDAWLARLGYTRKEALGRPFADFLTRDPVNDVMPIERCENLRRQMIKRGGGVIEVLLSAVPAEDLSGQSISLGVVTDITELVETSRQLADANRRLQALALQDELTGLADRQAFDEGLTVEYQRARRDDYSIAVIMIDVDDFKAFNDLYGRARGDHCLKLIAGAISRTVRRRGDIAARYDGDAFAIILPSAQEAGAMSVAARIQQAIVSLAIEHSGHDLDVATVGIGVAATWPATSTEVQESLVQDALQALRLARAQGRNGIVAASAAEAPLALVPAAAA